MGPKFKVNGYLFVSLRMAFRGESRKESGEVLGQVFANISRFPNAFAFDDAGKIFLALQALTLRCAAMWGQPISLPVEKLKSSLNNKDLARKTMSGLDGEAAKSFWTQAYRRSMSIKIAFKIG